MPNPRSQQPSHSEQLRLRARKMVRRYAEDDSDNTFIDLLVRVTERCIAYKNITEQEGDQRQIVRRAQGHIDLIINKLVRYANCGLEIMNELVEEEEGQLDEDEAEFERQKASLVSCVERTRQCLIERRRVVNMLYGRAQAFIDQCGTHGRQIVPDIEIDFDFCNHLSNFIAQDNLVSKSRDALVKSRRQLLKFQKASSAAEKKERRLALTRLQDQQEKVEMQEQNQPEAEQNFFMHIVHPLLDRAGILPQRRESVSSSSSGDLSRIPSRDRKNNNVNQPAEEGHQYLLIEDERLLNRKAALSKAVAELASLQKQYKLKLAEYLITYSNATKDRFDEVWARDIGGHRRYRAHEKEATAAVTAAREAYQQALREAEDADVIIPPSPEDTGNRSRDGKTDSEREDSQVNEDRARGKKKPSTRRWLKRVAKSGSPVDPEEAPRMPSELSQLSMSPPRSREGTPGIEVQTSERRVQRYQKIQERKRKRVREEIVDLERVGLGGQGNQGTGSEVQEKLGEEKGRESWVKKRCIIL